MSPAQLHAFPPGVQHGILDSFVRSLHTVFLVGVPLAAVTFVLTLFLKEIRLRTDSGLERPERGPGHGRRHVGGRGRRVRRGRHGARRQHRLTRRSPAPSD